MDFGCVAADELNYPDLRALKQSGCERVRLPWECFTLSQPPLKQPLLEAFLLLSSSRDTHAHLLLRARLYGETRVYFFQVPGIISL